MEQEIRFLRNKVKELESTVTFIQSEVRDKLGQVLERFFNYRADQIAKQQRALKLEEDICRNLLSCCNLFDEPTGPTTSHPAPTPRSSGGTKPGPKSKKRKRNRSGTGNKSPTNANTTPAGSREPSACKVSLRGQSNSTRDAGYDGGSNSEGEPEEAEGTYGLEYNGPEYMMKREPQERQQGAEAEDDDPDPSSTEITTENFETVTRVFREYIPTTSNGSTAWEYFLREETGQFAQCKVANCGRVFHNRKSTSSLRTHLRLAHGIDLRNLGKTQRLTDVDGEAVD